MQKNHLVTTIYKVQEFYKENCKPIEIILVIDHEKKTFKLLPRDKYDKNIYNPSFEFGKNNNFDQRIAIGRCISKATELARELLSADIQYTEKLMVDFGNYLLSERREKLIRESQTAQLYEDKFRNVYDSDLANWKETLKTY